MKIEQFTKCSQKSLPSTDFSARSRTEDDFSFQYSIRSGDSQSFYESRWGAFRGRSVSGNQNREVPLLLIGRHIRMGSQREPIRDPDEAGVVPFDVIHLRDL